MAKRKIKTQSDEILFFNIFRQERLKSESFRPNRKKRETLSTEISTIENIPFCCCEKIEAPSFLRRKKIKIEPLIWENCNKNEILTKVFVVLSFFFTFK